MGENIHEPGDKPDYNQQPARAPEACSVDPHERRDPKSSLGKAIFLFACLGAVVLVLWLTAG
ncbi:MAG: hypothetical protein AAF441_16385 [Pseudomonadota bacterium]